MKITPHLDPSTQLTFAHSRALDGGSVEITYTL
jgi:hypothetical protein